MCNGTETGSRGELEGGSQRPEDRGGQRRPLWDAIETATALIWILCFGGGSLLILIRHQLRESPLPAGMIALGVSALIVNLRGRPGRIPASQAAGVHARWDERRVLLVAAALLCAVGLALVGWWFVLLVR